MQSNFKALNLFIFTAKIRIFFQTTSIFLWRFIFICYFCTRISLRVVPMQVRLTALNWERFRKNLGENPRLSRSCELRYGLRKQSHCPFG